ncbi:hypothetical protein Taro_051607 [Colocasia esculenta]|uniref:Uncharacterized protein n=1 Tax=Colocasia esculenta TaxID=4460 RepID=A0A843XH92_COLES|nr:hypothetical protein [Colocasia esculenta]
MHAQHAELDRVRRAQAGASSSRAAESSQSDLEDRLADVVRRAEEAEFELTKRVSTNTFCKGGVDTPHNGVDTIPHTPRQKAEEMLRLCRHESKSRSTQDEIWSTLDLVPRTVCLQNGTGGRRRMRSGRHWTSFPEQFGTGGRHHHQGRSTHYGKIAT